MNSEGQVVDLSVPNATFSINGSNSSFKANTGIKGGNSIIEVINDAQLSVTTEITAGIKLGGKNTSLNIQSGGKLTILQTGYDDIDTNNYGNSK